MNKLDYSKEKFTISRGFTLIELVVVLSVIGIMATVAFFPITDRTTSVNAAREDVARAIRYTQSLSMSSQTRYRINLGLAATSYTITTADGLTNVSSNISGTSSLDLPSGVSMTNGGTLPNNYIVFDGYGIPYSDNSGTQLTSNATITFSANNSTALTITVYRLTGAVFP